MVGEQMTKRAFTLRQKRILKMISGNICEYCGKKLNGVFHADHYIPFSKGGKTILPNGRASCSSCNIKKGDKIIND